MKFLAFAAQYGLGTALVLAFLGWWFFCSLSFFLFGLLDWVIERAHA